MTMIDRKSRNLLATAIQDYLDLKTTSEDIHQLELDRNDRAVEQVYEAFWMMNSDFNTHDVSRLSSDLQDELRRYVLFLKSDLEYKWPDTRPNRLLMFLTFGLAYTPKRRKAFESAGDLAVWPFLSKGDYDKCRKLFLI